MKTAVFIDGASIHSMCQTIAKAADYTPVLKAASDTLVDFFTVHAFDDKGDCSVKKLSDFMAFNGARVIATEADAGNPVTISKARNVLIVKLALAMVRSKHNSVDHVHLFSGDGALAPAVEFLRDNGVRVTVFALKNVTSEDLRRAANHFVELTELEGFVTERKVRAA